MSISQELSQYCPIMILNSDVGFGYISRIDRHMVMKKNTKQQWISVEDRLHYSDYVSILNRFYVVIARRHDAATEGSAFGAIQ
jgi:hypothetical protein